MLGSAICFSNAFTEEVSSLIVAQQSAVRPMCITIVDCRCRHLKLHLQVPVQQTRDKLVQRRETSALEERESFEHFAYSAPVLTIQLENARS